jgi:hypothetical protein
MKSVHSFLEDVWSAIPSYVLVLNSRDDVISANKSLESSFGVSKFDFASWWRLQPSVLKKAVEQTRDASLAPPPVTMKGGAKGGVQLLNIPITLGEVAAHVHGREQMTANVTIRPFRDGTIVIVDDTSELDLVKTNLLKHQAVLDCMEQQLMASADAPQQSLGNNSISGLLATFTKLKSHTSSGPTHRSVQLEGDSCFRDSIVVLALAGGGGLDELMSVLQEHQRNVLVSNDIYTPEARRPRVHRS